MIRRFLKKWKSLKAVHFCGERSQIFCHSSVWFDIRGKLVLNESKLTLGYPLPKTIEYAHYQKSIHY